MKSKITQICGYIMFIAFIIGVGVYCVFFYIEVIGSKYALSEDEIFFILISPLLLFVGFYYLFSTRFWEYQFKELKTLEYQNEVLKKEIEKKKLLEKLGK